MLDGSYDIQMRTLLGIRRGCLTLHTDGDYIQGTLEILGSQNMIATGTVAGDSFHFFGNMKTAFGIVPYEAQGRLQKDALTILAQTSKGDFEITGARIEHN